MGSLNTDFEIYTRNFTYRNVCLRRYSGGALEQVRLGRLVADDRQAVLGRRLLLEQSETPDNDNSLTFQ